MRVYEAAEFEVKRPAFLATRKNARIVRLSAQVLWMPRPDAAYTEPVLIAREDWAGIHARCPGLHVFEEVPLARRRDILRAWLLCAPAPVRERGEDGFLSLVRETFVAADGLEPTDALAAVQSLVRAASENPDAPVAGVIATPDADESLLTLYLDTRPTADWRALARVRASIPAAGRAATGPAHDISTPDISRCDISGRADAEHAAGAARTGGAARRRGGNEWSFAFAPGLVFRPEAVTLEEVSPSEAACVGGHQLTFSFF